jgi:hypothetical protein
MTNKREINEYLYYESGEDGEASRISDDWPFELSVVGTFTTGEGETEVFLFTAEGVEYLAVAGPSLTYYPKAGMELHHLRMQSLGSSWIAGQDPLDLNTSVLGDESIPSTKERRQRIEDIARQYLGDTPFTILVGLFLRSSGKYLALVQPEGKDKAMIAGTNMVVRNIPFPSASAWRRLAVGIGNLIESGRLG